MAWTITVANLKGGVGKTTVAVSLAARWHQAGSRVLLVDADSQRTAAQWAELAAEAEHDEPPVVSVTGAAVLRDAERLGKGYDIVVIDAPPRLAKESRLAMLAADLVLLPTIPGAANVWALRETVAVLEEVQSQRPDVQGAIVLNRTDRTALATATREAVGDLAVPVLRSTLASRVTFGEFVGTGRGVTAYAPRSPAAAEVDALAREVLSMLRKK